MLLQQVGFIQLSFVRPRRTVDVASLHAMLLSKNRIRESEVDLTQRTGLSQVKVVAANVFIVR